MMPRRLTLSRQKGFRLPEGAVSVTRPGFWGNPFRVVHRADLDAASPWLCQWPGSPGGWHFKTQQGAAAKAVEAMRLMIEQLRSGEEMRLRLKELRGRDLACWCKPGEHCHADMLIELANGEAGARWA